MATLSQKEIWDDSALQNSWREAREEYDHYHSIHARGEKVVDVLREFESADGVDTNTENPTNVDIDMNDNDEGGKVQAGVDDHALASPPTEESTSNIPIASSKKDQNDSQSKPEASVPPGMPALPENLIGAVHDEDLKKLLMSWYYSGYYTGYYEGKQAGRLANNPTG